MSAKARVAITAHRTCQGARRLRPARRPGRDGQRPGPIGRDDSQGQHLLALPVPERQHDALAARGSDPRAARERASTDLSCVQNRTVVTNAFKGTDLNGYWPICKAYDVPVLFNFRPDDMKWVTYKPRAKMLVLDRIFDGHIRIPDYFFGKNVVHLPTAKCHIYTTTTGAMKNAFGGLLNERRHWTHSWIHETLVDLLTIQKEIHPGVFAMMDGTTAGQRRRTARSWSRRSRTSSWPAPTRWRSTPWPRS